MALIGPKNVITVMCCYHQVTEVQRVSAVCAVCGELLQQPAE